MLAAFVVVSLATGMTSSPARAAGPSVSERVRLPFPAYDGTLTPYTFALGYPLVTLVYDTLLWRDADGTPKPWLARSVTRSDDGRRLTVQLREGVRWHDGRPLTAADVAFTFRFVAAREQPRFTPQLGNVERVRATGRLTAEIDLRRPSPGFDDQPLADLPILPQHLWKGLPEGRSAPPGLPVGSGPYRLESARPAQGYVFRASRSYFLGTPRVDEIRVPIIDDAERTYTELRKRRVDMVPLNLPERAARTLDSALGIGLQRGPSYTGTALLLNLRRPPFDRLVARRAVARALDLERIVRNVAPAVAADEGFIHPESRWSAGARLQQFDAGAARAAAELGPAPVRVLAPDNDPVRVEAGRQVVLGLQRAGAEATLVKLSRTAFDDALGANGSPPDFDAAIESTPPLASHDPDGLTRMFGSDPRVATLNVGGYRSTEFDALARRVASTSDPQARLRATRAELELLAREVPAVPLFFSQGTFGYRPAIYDGWVFVKGTGILDKRSFLPGGKAAAGDGAGAPSPAVAAPGRSDSGGSGFGVVNVISIAVLAVIVILAAMALRQRRSDNRR